MLRAGCAAVLAAALAFGGGVAAAEVKSSAPDGMVLEFKGRMALPREAAFARVLALGTWWADSHTYSGKGSSMTVDPVAGGCWCELWDGGEVEHGRVIMLMKNQSIRFASALGPLQDLGVSAALTISVGDGPDDGASDVTMTYKVVGSSLSGLNTMAPIVDMVLKEQFDRLIAVPVQP